jgi:nicotinamide mononucleotide (NMN) deamidase PncC
MSGDDPVVSTLTATGDTLAVAESLTRGVPLHPLP